MWSIRGTREDLETGAGGATVSLLSLQLQRDISQPLSSQRWLIVPSATEQTSLPPKFDELKGPYRLPPPSAALAMPLTAQVARIDLPTRSARLFATLPLPIAISLPFHLHAPWILSRDRRSLRLDAPDAQGQRSLVTQYNIHLLECMVPELFFRAVAIVASKYSSCYDQCWPTKPGDEISRTLTEAIFSGFAKTPHAVCRTKLGDCISPGGAMFSTARSKHVEAVIAALKIPEYVSNIPFDRSMVDWKTLCTDNAETVTGIVQRNAADVALFFQDRAALEHLEPLLQFLVQDNRPLIGLPLLQRGDDRIVKFAEGTAAPIIGTNRPDIERLFGHKHVLGQIYNLTMVDQLISQALNVKALDSLSLRALLATLPDPITPAERKSIHPSRGEWFRDLCMFLSLAATTSLGHVSDLPIIPLLGGFSAVSLELLQRDNSILMERMLDSTIIKPALLKLGLSIIPSWFELPTGFTKPVHDVGHVLKAIGVAVGDISRLKTLHHRVDHGAWSQFQGWIIPKLTVTTVSRLATPEVNVSVDLSLFLAHGGGSIGDVSLRSASEVVMLPLGVSPQVTARYLPVGLLVVEYCPSLSNILIEGRASQALSADDLIDRFQLPTAIATEDEQAYRDLLSVVVRLGQGRQQKAFIPDEQGDLHMPSELFDHRVPLFQRVLSGRQNMLVHMNFRDDMDGLVRLGVRHMLGHDELLMCARVVDQDGRRGQLDRGRAEAFWEEFRGSSATRALDAHEIMDLRIVPARRERHSHTPAFSSFAAPLPGAGVVAMSQACTEELSPVIWTQRAQFMVEPPEFLKGVMREKGVVLGEPRVEEVVCIVHPIARHGLIDGMFRFGIWLFSPRPLDLNIPVTRPCYGT